MQGLDFQQSCNFVKNLKNIVKNRDYRSKKRRGLLVGVQMPLTPGALRELSRSLKISLHFCSVDKVSVLVRALLVAKQLKNTIL